jgi:hypothetical protein
MGVVSCFGATGLYDHGDQDPVNDICKLNIFFIIYTIRDQRGGGLKGERWLIKVNPPSKMLFQMQ